MTDDHGPITIARQGSFFVGGRRVKAVGTFDPTLSPTPGSVGQTFWVDQMYVQFQVPPRARRWPLVLVHGGGGTGCVWETTPDGREGYQTIFLRRGFPVYIVDSPRGGRSGFPSFNGEFGILDAGHRVVPDRTRRSGHEQIRSRWRLSGAFSAQAFPTHAEDQFLKHVRPMVSDDAEVIAAALSALLERIGPAILVTHSNSGLPGWLAGSRSPHVAAIVSYEPGFVFPEDDLPAPVPLYAGEQSPGAPIDRAAFDALSTVPIQVVYGDNIPDQAVPDLLADGRRAQVIACERFIAALNRAGGAASLLHLPRIGVRGNSHFMFTDLNNLLVADQVCAFLARHGLDLR